MSGAIAAIDAGLAGADGVAAAVRDCTPHGGDKRRGGRVGESRNRRSGAPAPTETTGPQRRGICLFFYFFYINEHENLYILNFNFLFFLMSKHFVVCPMNNSIAEKNI